MLKSLGKSSIKFEKTIYIQNSASVAGKKEGEGPLGALFDIVGEDDYFGKNTWEEAESQLQIMAAKCALKKAQISKEEIRYILAGDLLGQNIASSFALMELNIPLFGLYGACSTCGESLTLGSILVDGEFGKNVLCVTSSHFASAEKEFRFPLEYGSQRPLCASWTATASGAFVLGSDVPKNLPNAVFYPVIKGVTTGKIVDYGLKDSMNMGCCMAPAACDTIYQSLKDFDYKPEDYTKIITGDLGSVGKKVLLDLLNKKGVDISNVHMDCGMEIFDKETQDTNAGGSGCGCAASVLSAMILPKVMDGTWKRVLFIPTGALLSKVSFNEGKTVPGIAHAVIIEGSERK